MTWCFWVLPVTTRTWPRSVKQLLEEVGDAPSFKLAGFVTHAPEMSEGGARALALYDRWAGACARAFQQASEEKEINLLGYFHYQGAPSLPIETFIHNTIVTDEQEWTAYITAVREHPDQADLEQAGAFARQVLETY